MPTFIKTGFWEKVAKGYKGWLNLDDLIASIASGSSSAAPTFPTVQSNIQYINDTTMYAFVVETSVYSSEIIFPNLTTVTANIRFSTNNSDLKPTKISFPALTSAGQILFSGADHAGYVDAGRRPGSMPPKGVLLAWMKLKGIPAKAEFPIRRSIFLFGIKPTPFIDQSIDDNAYLLGVALDEAILVSVDVAMKYKG